MMESIPNLNEARLKIVYPQIADLPYAAQEAVISFEEIFS